MKESKTYVNHKDTIFCLLYRDKDNLLDLYNGMNGTSYSDTENLMVTTLKNGIYVKYKNDASFVFSQDLYMFEKKNKETQIECGMTEQRGQVRLPDGSGADGNAETEQGRQT